MVQRVHLRTVASVKMSREEESGTVGSPKWCCCLELWLFGPLGYPGGACHADFPNMNSPVSSLEELRSSLLLRITVILFTGNSGLYFECCFFAPVQILSLLA